MYREQIIDNVDAHLVVSPNATREKGHAMSDRSTQGRSAGCAEREYPGGVPGWVHGNNESACGEAMPFIVVI